MSICSIILAGGEDNYMQSNMAKPLHKVCGRAVIDWVLNAAKESGAQKNIIVLGDSAEQIKEHLGGGESYQYIQRGTAEAVLSGAEQLAQDCKTVMVLRGDCPLIQGETLRLALSEHLDNRRAATVICEINAGIYIFDIEKLCSAFPRVTNDNAGEEGYFVETVETLIADGENVGTYTAPVEEILRVNDRVQLAEAEKIQNSRLVKAAMLSGVTMIDPSTVHLGADVVLGRDTVLYPSVILEGKTEIGSGCTIGPNTRLTDCVIGDGSEVINSVGTDSRVGSNTHVGPFAYLRPNSSVGSNVKIGDFVEIKNSNIGDGTKVAHLTYVGDADVGERVNFGCGTVVVNYDGTNKHRTTIGDDAFIGCNTNLVSPVTINDRAYTAAGSTITEEVPAGALAIARSRQTVKESWADKRKK